MMLSQGEKVNAGALKRLLVKQKHKCAYTGVDLTPDLASLDHIVPLSNGGSHFIDNVSIIHKDINRMKGTLGLNEFVALCVQIANRFSGVADPQKSVSEAVEADQKSLTLLDWKSEDELTPIDDEDDPRGDGLFDGELVSVGVDINGESQFSYSQH